MFETIGNSLLVYPSSLAKTYEERKAEFNQLIQANGAALDLIHNVIDVETFCDIVEESEVDMDDYLDTVCDKLELYLEI